MRAPEAMEPALCPEGEPHATINPAGELDIGREANPNTNALQLAAHPAADLFPLMSSADFDALAADMKLNGQIEPIVVHDGMILDGRHRYRACLQIGLQPVTTEWDGSGTPEAFAISKNLHRRQLDASQRAMVAAAFATLKRGGDQSVKLRNGLTAAALSKMFNVSTRSIETARVVRAKGAPELIEAVQRGDMKVSTAADLVDSSKDRQRELTAAGKYEVAKAVGRKRRNEAIRREREKASRTPVSDIPEALPDTISLIDKCAMEVRRIVLAALSELDAEGVAALITELRGEVDDIDQVAEKRVNGYRAAHRDSDIVGADFRAEADAMARDLEIERDERIALSGASEVAAENEKLKSQIRQLDLRIMALGEEAASQRTKADHFKRVARTWEERAKAAGWREKPDG